MVRLIGIGSALLVFLSLLGCSNPQSGYDKIKDDDIISRVSKAASKLVDDDVIGPGHRIIVTSFANVDDLSTSSRFGRMIAQQFAAEIASAGYTVIEILMSDALQINSAQGEFLLSREVAMLGEKHDADVVVVGTYAEGRDNVYITTKLIRASDSVVLSASNFDINLGPDARLMIR